MIGDLSYAADYREVISKNAKIYNWSVRNGSHILNRWISRKASINAAESAKKFSMEFSWNEESLAHIPLKTKPCRTMMSDFLSLHGIDVNDVWCQHNGKKAWKYN